MSFIIKYAGKYGKNYLTVSQNIFGCFSIRTWGTIEKTKKQGVTMEQNTLTLPQGTRAVADGAYAGREDIHRVILPEGLTAIGNEAFTGCISLEEVVLPDSLTAIGAAAFAGCEQLAKSELPPALRRIGEGAFLDCTALHQITLPQGLRHIEPMAFWNSGLYAVDVPESVERIGESAFWTCENLRCANVWGRDTVIEKNAFGSDYALIEGYMAPGYPNEDSAPAELQYTLLWCSCPDRHTEEVSERAKALIRAQEGLIMERILKYDNTPALSGLVRCHLLTPANIDGYLRTASEANQTDLVALLLEAKGNQRQADTDFEL